MDKDIKLTDLIGVETLQRIQDSFAKMARMATLISDENGTALTNGSNFSEYCTEYCRKSTIAKKDANSVTRWEQSLFLRVKSRTAIIAMRTLSILQLLSCSATV